MRKILLAGVALAAAAAYLPTPAHAQASSSPVTVYIGGRVFTGVFISNTSGQNNSGTKYGTLAFPDYMRLYPQADYAAPNGVHYGFSAELRSSTATTARRYNQPVGTLYWEHAYSYVSSPMAGKLQFGAPPNLLEQVQVGMQNDIGTGGYDGEYGFSANGPLWLFTDINETKTSLQYWSPNFAGFTLGLSYTPYDNNLTDGSDIISVDGSTVDSTKTNRFRNMVMAALTYGGNVGPVGLKAEVGGMFAGKVNNTAADATHYKSPNMLDVGVSGSIAGVTVGAHVTTGKYDPSMEPLPDGAKTTTAYIMGAQYAVPNPQIPLAFGGSYYHYDIDGSAYGLTTGSNVKFDGGALGASYKLVPGVTLFLDALYGQQKAEDGVVFSNGRSKIDSTGLGIGSYFQW